MSRAAAQTEIPPVVYVPCSPLTNSAEDLIVDLRPTQDGRLALLVYTALDRLVDCCGDEQPWVVMPTVSLEKVRRETHFELLLLDVEIPEEFRRRAAGALPQPGR